MSEYSDLSSWAVALDLPLSPAAPAAGRRLLRSTLLAWGVTGADVVQDADLLVSELVTNAVVHGAGEVCLEAWLTHDLLRIAVRDGSAVLPDRRQAGPLDGGGRGMEIVEALASRWGVDVLPDGGKRVFVELVVDVPSARRR